MFNRKKIKALKKDVERLDHLYRQEQMVSNTFKRVVNAQETTIKDLNDEIEELKAKNVMLKKKYTEVVEDNFKMAEQIYEMRNGDTE